LTHIRKDSERRGSLGKVPQLMMKNKLFRILCKKIFITFINLITHMSLLVTQLLSRFDKTFLHLPQNPNHPNPRTIPTPKIHQLATIKHNHPHKIPHFLTASPEQTNPAIHNKIPKIKNSSK
jgi:hypothetical protein